MYKKYGEIENQLLLYTPREEVVKMYIELLKNNDKAISFIESNPLVTRCCYEEYAKDILQMEENHEDMFFIGTLLEILKSNKKIMNKDFYDDLPGMVCLILDDLIEKYRDKEWFEDAWEEYREHILISDMDSMKMPDYVFNKYIDLEEDKGLVD